MSKEDILRLLSSSPNLTTSDIAKRLNQSRTTVIKYLKEMVKEGLVSYRKIGSAKLWFLLNDAEKEARKTALKEKAKSLSKELSFLEDGFALEVFNENEIETLKKARKILEKRIKG